jgi:hypothetical protein
MSVQSIWIRLNIDWDESPWLFVLSAGSQLAWIKLLCRVKTEGRHGTVKALSPEVAAKKWGVGSEDVEKLLRAASEHGAVLIEDGFWTITSWGDYQNPESKRKAEQRNSQECPGQSGTETDTAGQVRDSAGLLSRDSLQSHISSNEDRPGTPVRGRKPDSPPGRLAESLPEEYRTPELESAWADFETHRKEKKAGLYTPTGCKNLASQLVSAGYGPDDVPALIRRCVSMNWTGIPSEEIPRFKATRLRVVEGGESIKSDRPEGGWRQVN